MTELVPTVGFPSLSWFWNNLATIGWVATFIGWSVTLWYYSKLMEHHRRLLFWTTFWVREAAINNWPLDPDHVDWADENAPGDMTVEGQLEFMKRLEEEQVHPMFMDMPNND